MVKKTQKGGRSAQLGKMNSAKKKTIQKNKTSGTAIHKSGASTNPYRPDPSGGKKGSQFRTKATIKRLNMYTEKPDQVKMRKQPTDPTAGRVQPDRRWFGNVRTLDQKELDRFRTNLAQQEEKKGSGFSVLLKGKKLPLSLVKDQYSKTLSQGERLLQIQSYSTTFGPKMQRKRPNLGQNSLMEMMTEVQEKQFGYDEEKDIDLHKNDIMDMRDAHRDKIFEKGLSKRIWEELYKVIDSSDVLIYVLDARNPNGTRTKYLEDYLKNKCPHKHLIFVLNKCDLIPTSVTQKWVKYLSQFYPTLAFQASLKNPFGKGSLIQLLKQFDRLHQDRKNISVGFIGYPNVGKSSVINTLKKKAVCKVAPIPGETKVWQYITMTKRIYLIDCPGIVYDHGETEVDKVLKSVIRAEKVPEPEIYVEAILERVDRKKIEDVYGVSDWVDTEDFIMRVAERTGKLKKGGEADSNNVCKSIIMDWQRGNIPYFTLPPSSNDQKEEEESKNEKEEADIIQKST